MLTVLTGAKQNLGDFLITERCRALLGKHHPDEELVQFPAWEPVTAQLDTINASRALVIMGGPCWLPSVYPGTLPLTPNLDDIKVPLVMVGAGWKGTRGDWPSVKAWRYSEDALRFMRKMAGTHPLSCRDYLSLQTLKLHGFDEVVMTGCPAWYHLPSLGQPFTAPAGYTRIAYTPAFHTLFKPQSIAVGRMLKELFPDAEIRACFHQGYEYRGLSANPALFKAQAGVRDALAPLGIECLDLSMGTEGTDVLAECDLHVGYRVHAHIDRLSKRRASILIHEDGRGAGVNDALGLPGVDGYSVPWPVPGPKVVKRVVNNGLRRLSPYTAEALRALIEREIEGGFARFQEVGKRIDRQYQVMSAYLDAL